MIFHIDHAAGGLVRPLFSSNKHDRVMIDCVLDGHGGSIMADSKTAPSVARLDSGSFTMFGGDPLSSACMELIHSAPVSFVTPENEIWQRLLQEAFSGRYSLLPFVEYKADCINIAHLKNMITAIPADYELQMINKALAARVEEEIGNPYFYEHFSDIDDFLQRGVGYCMVYRGEIVSAATTMAASAKAVDIEIETVEQHRRKGLGSIVGAKLVLHCLRQDIDPKWLAANEDSARLAARLGFQRGGSYTTMAIDND